MIKKITHDCHEDDDGIRVSTYLGNPYWMLEWNFEDENDPCYGTLVISYCPFCGVRLRSISND